MRAARRSNVGASAGWKPGAWLRDGRVEVRAVEHIEHSTRRRRTVSLGCRLVPGEASGLGEPMIHVV
jgi:hypothetical protein